MKRANGIQVSAPGWWILSLHRVRSTVGPSSALASYCSIHSTPRRTVVRISQLSQEHCAAPPSRLTRRVAGSPPPPRLGREPCKVSWELPRAASTGEVPAGVRSAQQVSIATPPWPLLPHCFHCDTTTTTMSEAAPRLTSSTWSLAMQRHVSAT